MSSRCDTSGVNLEQYCSLLKSIKSLLFDEKLESDSESETNRLDNNLTGESCVSLEADGDSCEQVKKEECQLSDSEPVTNTSDGKFRHTRTTVNGNCQLVSKKPIEKDSDDICRMVTEENTDKIVNKSNSVTKLGITTGKSSDRHGKDLSVAKNDVQSSSAECDHTGTNLTVKESDSDEGDDDDELLIELCSKKADHENSCDVSEVSKGTKCDETKVESEQLSDDVLWKEGDIEVRLEVGEDESSNSPARDDDTAINDDKTTSLGENNSDLSVRKMPRTSIRISLSKLTAHINGDYAAELPGNCASRVKEEPSVGRGRRKAVRPQKPKLRKNCVKLQRSRSDSTKTGKLNKTKCSKTGKLKHLQETCSTDNQPIVRPRGRPRKILSQSVEAAFSDTVNGICTRRMHSTSDGKRVQSLNTSNAVTESNVKSVLRDATVSKGKKRRASRGVEYIDDDVVSSPHHAVDDSTHVNAKKKTVNNSHVDEHGGSSVSFIEVDANSQPASDKENDKSTTVTDKNCVSTHGLNTRKQIVGKRYRRSYSATGNRKDTNASSGGGVMDNVIASSMEDACVDGAVSFRRRTVSSSGEENQTSSDNEEKSKLRCTTEEMFRQIGRDGLECRFCHRELRTRTQLLQHAKIQCHLQHRSSPGDAHCSAVDAGKQHTSDVDMSESESQCPVAVESPKAGVEEADKKTSTIHVDALNGVNIKNCIIEISPVTEKTYQKKAEAEVDIKHSADESENSPSISNAAASDTLADCVCDGCGEVVPDCSWLTAHIVTCPGRSGTGDEISNESFHPDASQWNSEQDNVLVSESGLESVTGEAGAQPVEVDAASLLQLLCTVENSLLCTVSSESDVGCQPITVVSDSLLQENGSTTVNAADTSHEVGQFGREVVHDGVAMYEFAEYRCSMCPVTFLDQAAATRHVTGTKVHSACTVEHTSIYCCMQCDMRYRDQQLMWYHVTYICQQSEAAAVPASEVHRCAYCAKQFLTAEYLSRHCHIQHSTELSNIDSQMTLRELALANRQQSTSTNNDVSGSETQKQLLQALANATMRNSTNSTPKSRKEAALLRSKLVIASNTLPTRRTAKGIVYKNVFMQCIVSYICSNCGRDLSTKQAKREHRVAAPDSCFDSGPGGRRLFTYVRHYSYLCPYCNERSATQKACRAHQLATCLPRMGVKTDELNHKQLLCPFCQRKYFNVITLKGHMTLVHQISRAESNQLLAGVTGASEEVGTTVQHDGDRTTVNTASLGDSSTMLHQPATKPFNNTASVDSVADDDDDEDNSVADDDDDSNSIRSESASRDGRFETVDATLPLFTSSHTKSSTGISKNGERRASCTSSENSSDDDDDDDDGDIDSDNDKSDDDDDESVQSPVTMRRHFSTCQKPKRMPPPKVKNNFRRKS